MRCVAGPRYRCPGQQKGWELWGLHTTAAPYMKPAVSGEAALACLGSALLRC